MTYAALRRAVRGEIAQEHRYAHSVRVARMAELLAQVHGADTGRARTAGMLHDLARLYSIERLVSECAARGLTVDAFERANPIVLHARLGAEFARERFGVTDEVVLSAIRKHTLAAAEMSLLDEILYLADGLEPGRDFPGHERLAALAFVDVRAAMRAVLESTIDYLQSRGLAPAPQTLAALQRYRHAEKESLSA